MYISYLCSHVYVMDNTQNFKEPARSDIKRGGGGGGGGGGIKINFLISFVCFVVLHPSEQLWSC